METRLGTRIFLGMTRDFIFRNTFADIEYAIKALGQGHGTRFEFECYDLGHLYNLAWMMDQGLDRRANFRPNGLWHFGRGWRGFGRLMHMHTIMRTNCLAQDYEWSVAGRGTPSNALYHAKRAFGGKRTRGAGR